MFSSTTATMKVLLLLLLALSNVEESSGFIFGLLESIWDFGTKIFGDIFDWGITTANKFVDTTFRIGGTAINYVVDPFGWFKGDADDHGHNSNNVKKCPARSDIVFVFDTSGTSLWNQFDLQKQFAIRLSEHFQIGDKDVRFGAITFSDRVQKVFDLKSYSDHASLRNAINNIPFLGGFTRTYAALDYVRESGVFSTSQGAREQSSKMAVVITDGSSDSLLKTNAAAEALKKQYTVVAIGIGSGLGIELYNIASGSNNVFTADNFDNLVRIEQRVARRLCEIPEAEGNIPVADNKCAAGFEKNPKNPSTCIDVNECKTGTSGCQQNCVNLVGSYRCSCKAGFVINTKDTTKCTAVQQCTDVVDVIFALDASGSMGSDKFKLQQTFAAKLTHHFAFGSKGAQFASLLFATEVRKLFDLNSYSTRTDVTARLLDAPYIQGGTNTHLALNYIVDQGLFSPASGGRSNARKVLVLITDGASSNPPKSKEAVNRLKSLGVSVLALGISEQADLKELADLVGSDNVSGVVDFDLLDYVEEELADHICS